MALFKKDFTYLFLERGGEREKEGEKHQCMAVSYAAPHWGPGLQLRHVSSTGNETSNPLVCRLALNPLSHTSQG